MKQLFLLCPEHIDKAEELGKGIEGICTLVSLIVGFFCVNDPIAYHLRKVYVKDMNMFAISKNCKHVQILLCLTD